MESIAKARLNLAAFLAVLFASACSTGTPHSAQDYANAGRYVHHHRRTLNGDRANGLNAEVSGWND